MSPDEIFPRASPYLIRLIIRLLLFWLSAAECLWRFTLVHLFEDRKSCRYNVLENKRNKQNNHFYLFRLMYFTTDCLLPIIEIERMQTPKKHDIDRNSYLSMTRQYSIKVMLLFRFYSMFWKKNKRKWKFAKVSTILETLLPFEYRWVRKNLNYKFAWKRMP